MDESIETIRAQVNARVAAEKLASSGGGEAIKSTITNDDVIRALNRNEDGDASLFIKLHRDHFCYDAADGAWYVFRGPHWGEDRCGEAARAIDDVIDLYLKAAVHQGALKIDAVKAGKSEDGERFKRTESDLLKRVKQLQTAAKKQHILELARTGAGSLAINGPSWDGNPWVIGCENGTIDLKSGDIRAGVPEDFIRTIVPVKYPGLETPTPPTFEGFLRDITTGDEAVLDYLHRLFGYGITGLSNNHVYPVFYGLHGRNGKTTLLEVLKYVLGDCAHKCRAEILLETKFSAPRGGTDADTLALRGKRLVWCSESGDGRRLNAARVKELVGGDTLTARAPFGKFPVEFRPSHLLLLLTNFRPIAPANDDAALWERIRLIEFKTRFVDDPAESSNERKADPDLLEKLRADAPGIFSWLIRGCLKWQAEGLSAPDSVKASTGTYRKDADILSKFFEARCFLGDLAEVQAGIILKAYREWCTEMGLKPINGIRFHEAMNERFDSRPGRYIHYLGISLLIDADSSGGTF